MCGNWLFITLWYDFDKKYLRSCRYHETIVQHSRFWTCEDVVEIWRVSTPEKRSLTLTNHSSDHCCQSSYVSTRQCQAKLWQRVLLCHIVYILTVLTVDKPCNASASVARCCNCKFATLCLGMWRIPNPHPNPTESGTFQKSDGYFKSDRNGFEIANYWLNSVNCRRPK